MKPARIENHTNELPAPPDWDAELSRPDRPKETSDFCGLIGKAER